MVRILDWVGCYDESWKGEIVDEGFAHPAKFSRALIRRIYDYALEQGYFKPGDTILDPFGGEGLGAKDALANGLNYVGIELEQKFVDMGAGCECTGVSKEDWVRLYGRQVGQMYRANYQDGRYWCPACLYRLGQIEDEPERPLSYESQKRRGRIRELQKKKAQKLKETGRSVVLLDPLPLPGSELARQVMAPKPIMLSFFDDVGEASPNDGVGYKRNSGRIPHTRPHYYAGNLNLFRPYARDGARAVLLQGDSRRLVEIIQTFIEGAVSSPPFAGNSGGRGEASRQGIDPALFDRHAGGMKRGTGDSPDNLDHLKPGDLDGVIGSPSYAVDGKHDYTKEERDQGEQGQGSFRGHYGHTPGQLAKMPEGLVGSPPFANAQTGGEGIYDQLEQTHNRRLTRRSRSGGYRADLQGQSPGQLGQMEEGDPAEGLVGSPPYAGIRMDGTIGKEDTGRMRPYTDEEADQWFTQRDQQNLGNLRDTDFEGVVSSPPFVDSVGSDDPQKRGGLYRDPKRSGDTNLTGTYGSTEGQLGAMAEGAVGSPPYEGSVNQHPEANETVARIERMKRAGIDTGRQINVGGQYGVYRQDQAYGSTEGQIGAETGETFWSAARLIVDQAYYLLAPQSYQFWVVKDFIRDGQRVEFGRQWQRLCEACGFETVEIIRAWVVKYRGLGRSPSMVV